jgi:ribosome-binding protein aMBF1 (putative translation factor)
MTPDQLRTARALLGWSRRQLSARSGISLNVVKVLAPIPFI